MSQMQVGTITLDVCHGGCGGIWFDAFELQQVDEQEEAAGEHLLEIARDKSIVVDQARKRECPRCSGIKLKRHFFSAKRNVEVDQCPNCNGYWLDAGELEKIRSENTEKAEEKNLANTRLSSETIRYLYRMRTQA
jgi:Zn-finger nucleic acid-binding protein